MHIKEIQLEGFKSYATRTVVSGFDPFFNAITGLNGSGKSNILDSICFVLGITNLQQVRATNLQELVYKQGQAGINKASVSILFDNSDRNRSPLTFEDKPEITVTRQIVVGGRNKYLINGKQVQPNQVQNLFHSVQLNVNNPHFLIMQGRITKVLNMKPPEILSMLEEAAGTRMYETKKDAALKTLEKKQSKVDEIDKLLDHEILPALEKLRKERTQYMQWASGNAELDRLRRFCIAYEFIQAEKVRDSAMNGMEKMKARISEMNKDIENMNNQTLELETQMSALISEKETSTGGEARTLSEKVDALSRDLVKETSILRNKEDNLNSEKKNAAKIEKSIVDIKKSVEDKDIASKKAEHGISDTKKRVEQLFQELEQHESDYQGVLAGKSSSSESKCMEDQLRDAKAFVGVAETELNSVKTEVVHFEKELKEKKEELLSKHEEAAAVGDELDLRKRELDKLKSVMESLAYEEGEMESLEKDRSAEAEIVQKLRDEIRMLTSHLSHVEFNYRDPVKNFERSNVKGVVARLIRVKDISAATALEVAAGGKLFNVVVDSEKTGKQLLENGDLRRRVTIIPLNKIRAPTVSSNVQKTATKLVGKENVQLALHLVGYDDEIKSAVEYVFGSTFVCKTIDAAKQVAFHRDIRTPSVTFEGDIFQPSGLLTGGSRRGGGDMLRQLGVLAEKERLLHEHERRLFETKAKIDRIAPVYLRFDGLKKQLELKSHELVLFESRAQQNEHHKLAELVRDLERRLAESRSCCEERRRVFETGSAAVRTLEKSIGDHAKNRESRLRDLEKKIKSAKSKAQSASSDLKEKEISREKLVLEKEELTNEILSLEKTLALSLGQTDDLFAELELASGLVSSVRSDLDRARSELGSVRSRIKDCDARISRLSSDQRDLQQRLADAAVERKKTENEIRRAETDRADSASRVDGLLAKHPWIPSERPLFGRPGTDYDLGSRDPTDALSELDRLHAVQSALEKRVNKKVTAMFEKSEDEYADLMSKKTIIENDKSKIERVIRELDEKKKETLRVTWVKVNADFGSIFSTLLPGTAAKLDPPEGRGFLDGLEVRVAFGGVWKQSLSELSGGQRSLLALSLILALLLFKPAPLYILDEVDAALDLSHTQNIGRMIKAHFPHSQFIVVSLKEGMFSNANVLFRTKFVDGVSTVHRTNN